LQSLAARQAQGPPRREEQQQHEWCAREALYDHLQKCKQAGGILCLWRAAALPPAFSVCLFARPPENRAKVWQRNAHHWQPECSQHAAEECAHREVVCLLKQGYGKGFPKRAGLAWESLSLEQVHC